MPCSAHVSVVVEQMPVLLPLFSIMWPNYWLLYEETSIHRSHAFNHTALRVIFHHMHIHRLDQLADQTCHFCNNVF